MKNYMLLLISLAISLLFVSCGGMNLPTVEESKLQIDKYTISYVELKKELAAKIGDKKQKEDVQVCIKTDAINNLMYKFSTSKANDINLHILQTNEIFAENKSTLGISYKNYVNVDNGNLDLDLKKIKLENTENNKLIGALELEGKGKVKVNGKYLGVPVSAEPEIQLYLNDQFQFEAKPINGKLFLVAEKKSVLLKTKISIKLLEWSLPYYKEIPLEVSDMIKPIELPLGINSEIQFPMPAKTYGESRVEFTPLAVELNNTILQSTKDLIKIKTNVNFKKQ